jgi:hypothetical protein
MNSICTHRFISLGDNLYEWCRLCGLLVYHYEDCACLPFEVLQDIVNGISYDKRAYIEKYSKFVQPTNLRAFVDHKHSLFILSASDSWCTICGTLFIKRPLMNNGFVVEMKQGFLVPMRRSSALQIREEANLPIKE